MTSRSPTLKTASRMSMCPPEYLPTYCMKRFIMITSEITTQKRLICFSNIFYYSLRSIESKPSVSTRLKSLTCWSQTPRVQRYRMWDVSSTGNRELNIALRSVLFPEDCVPRMDTVRLASGYSSNSSLLRRNIYLISHCSLIRFFINLS